MSIVYYLDASAWVKHYFVEAGSSWVEALFRREITLASTVLGYIEVAATLARRSRPGISVPQVQRQLMAEWNDFLELEITPRIYDQALLLAWDRKLRGADAIHLAAARELHDQLERRSSGQRARMGAEIQESNSAVLGSARPNPRPFCAAA